MRFEELLEAAGIKVSDEQRAAIAADTSAVVSAGAGSGKTTVLSLRFARLVMDAKAHADEILTLTFTRKAAAEMYERIYSLLSIAAEKDERIETELKEHFPRSRISTMDSFWSEIARTDSLRFGITRDFQSLETDEAAADDLIRTVYEEIQEDESLQEGFTILSSLYRTDELLSIFSDIAINKSDILTLFDSTANTASYINIIKILETEYMAKGDFIFSSLESLDDENPSNGQHDEIRKSLLAYKVKDFSSLPSFNLNKLRKAADAPIRLFIKENGVKEYFEILSTLTAIKRSEEDAEAVSAVIAAFIKAFQSKKRTMGLLSYRDTESLCREVLITNTDVRDYYKTKYHYIMVDEFQDNNGKQRDLLYLLAERMNSHSAGIPSLDELEKDKLFFVGDDKQSIYYFRGADVSVFRSLKDSIKRMGGLNLSLSANYRSEPALINHFNNVFKGVFNTQISEEDLVKENLMESITGESFTSFYADAELIKSRDAIAGIVPRIESAAVIPDKEEDKASDADSEAIYIARKIVDMVSSDDYLVSDRKGGVRRPSFGDIAILLRTTAPQMPIERAFRLYGIPYVVQESTSVTIEGVGWDIYAFLQLLIYPDDKLAFMAVLRSPFARISDEGLLSLTGEENYSFYSDICFSDDKDSASYEAIKALYFKLRSMAGRRRITEILSRLFYESGYSTYLNSSPYLSSYSEHFSYIWAAASEYDANSRSLVSFLDYLRPLIGQPEKLRNAVVQHLASDGVQIMTIHRSKGLQFPIVFLSDADHGSSNQSARGKLIALEGKNPCIMPDLTEGGNLIIKEIAGYRKRREEAELRRLLYVALTRAVDHLIVTAHMRTRRTGVSLLDIYQEGCSMMPDEIEQVSESVLFREIKDEDRSAWYSLPTAPEPVYRELRFGVKEAVSEDSDSVGTELPSLSSDRIVMNHSMHSDFGTMVHSVLEAVMKDEVPQLAFPPELEDWERDEIIKSLEEIKNGFLSSDFYNRYIKGRKHKEEVRFYYPMDGGVAEGSADLLLFFDDFNLVVDYKTDRFMNEDVHRGQIQAYAEAMEELYKKKCFAVLLYVRGWKGSTFIDKEGNPVKEPLQL